MSIEVNFEEQAEDIARYAMSLAEAYELHPRLTAKDIADVLVDALTNVIMYGPLTIEEIPEVVVTVLDQIADGV